MVRWLACLALLVPSAAHAQRPVHAMVEFELSAMEAYPGEQVIATVRLYGSERLLTSALTDPTSDRAVVRPLGEGMAARVARGGISYDVFERRYAVFPLAAGTLTLAAPSFKGFFSLHDGPDLPLGGMLPTGPIREVQATAPARTLQVRAAPGDGAAWLPASRLELLEFVDPPTGPYVVGQAFHRRVELVAYGQLHTALPPPGVVHPEGLEALPDAVEAETELAEAGAVARWRQQWALIPRREGELVLPAVTVRWWDTRQRQVRAASIESRTLQVLGAGRDATPSAAVAVDAPASKQSPWPFVASVASLGWAVTVAAWWRQRRARSSGPARDLRPAQARREAVAEVRRALVERDPQAARVAIVRWGRALFPDADVTSLGAVAVATGSEPLRRQLQALDRALYGRGGAWDPVPLGRALAAVNGGGAAKTDTTALPPLYAGVEEPDVPAPPRPPRLRAWLAGVALLVGAVAVILVALPGPNPVSAQAYRERLPRQQDAVLEFLRAFERIQDEVHPARIASQQAELAGPVGENLSRAHAELEATEPPGELRGLHARWFAAVAALDEARRVFVGAGPADFVPALFRARERFLAGLFGLYEMRGELPRLRPYWLLEDAPEPDVTPAATAVPVGILFREATAEHAAYALYVPESYDPARRWPLLVALHGSHGSARGALATWLRVAHSRGWMVLAPKSADASWNVEDPAAEVVAVAGAIAAVERTYQVDGRRIFLSGLSDGGTFSYLAGLRCPGVFAGIAPIAGVLPPGMDLSSARRLPVLIAHGEDDWVFPVEGARGALETLRAAGVEDATLATVRGWGHGLNVAVNAAQVLPWMERRAGSAASTGALSQCRTLSAMPGQ
jgi:phospholipase/carboxylesterase